MYGRSAALCAPVPEPADCADDFTPDDQRGGRRQPAPRRPGGQPDGAGRDAPAPAGRAFDAGAVPRDRGQAIAVLRRAVEPGVNHIDTAAFSFSALRSAHELINTALAPYPADLVGGAVHRAGGLRAEPVRHRITARAPRAAAPLR